MARKNRNSRARRKRNRKKRKEALESKSRDRKSFFGKARKGDAAEIDLTFSGVPVPYDEDEPSKDLEEKTKVQEALWDRLSDETH